MNSLLKFVKTAFSTHTIGELKDTKLYKSLLFFLFLSTFLNFGLAISIINMNRIDPTIVSKTIYQDISTNQINQFPNCSVTPNLQLICESKDVFIQEFDRFNLIINPNKQYNFNHKPNIIFLKDKIEIMNKDETVYNLNYKYFKGVNFATYHDLEPKTVVDDLSSRLFLSLKPYVLLPLLLVVYIMVISFNFIFIFGLASLGKLLNIGHRYKYTYRQLLNLVIYSSTFPAFLTFFVSIYFSPIFGVVVYNFSLALLFLYVCKNEIKGNLS